MFILVCSEVLILIFFGSDRSSRNTNVCPSVCPFRTKCSRAVNLHLFRSESTQKATKEQLSSQRAVIQSEPKILRLVKICLEEGVNKKRDNFLVLVAWVGNEEKAIRDLYLLVILSVCLKF